MEHFDWHVFFHLLFSSTFLKPAGITFFATVVSMVIGIALGLIGGVCGLSKVRLLETVVRGYLWVFRGIPTLVQIIFWYDALPELTGNAVNLAALPAGILALGVNEGAYMTEIIRSGLLSIDEGQREAARAVGMTRGQILWNIVIPQAMKVIVPPTGNQIINMLKNTSLLFAIAVPEVFSTGMNIYSENFRYFEVIAVMSIIYLALSTIITWFVAFVERVIEIPDGMLADESGRAAEI